MDLLSSEELRNKQQMMEARYSLPYNWLHPKYSIRYSHKQGLFAIITQWIRKDASLLDIGCGDGWYTARFGEMGATVTGIDPSERAIGFAKLIYPRGAFLTGTGEALPFPAKQFDVITCIQVLEHLTEAAGEKLLKECCRVIKPGGYLIISVPSTLRSLAESKAHLRHYTPESLLQVVAPFGRKKGFVGHEFHSRIVRRMKNLFENRWYFLPRAARFFYERYYFPRWNQGPVEKCHNLVICLEIRGEGNN